MSKQFIIKKIFPKRTSSNWYGILTTDNYKLFGFNYFEPMVDDIIICNNLIQRDSDNNKEFDFKNAQFLLPKDEKLQIKRLLHLSNGNNKTINDLIFGLSQNNIKYGDEFWNELYIYCSDLKEIDNYEINEFLTNLFDHIINYIASFLQPFKQKLNDEYNIKNLTIKQLTELYKHRKFGPNINSWNIDGLKELFNISGFGEETILKIARGLKLSIDDISQLIIIGIFLKNGSTYIKYDYNIWLEYLSNYSNNIGELSNDTFNDIIENMINSKDIILINEKVLAYYSLYQKELSIAKILINFQYNESAMSLLNISNRKESAFQDFLDEYKENEIYDLDKEQKQGIINFIKNNISVVSGRAGTGKSTLLKGLLSCIEKCIFNTSLQIFFLTPTASAIQRIKEILLEKWDDISKYDFRTLHGFNIRLEKNIDNILDKMKNNYNIIIIDETSMVDIILLNNLLTRLCKINKNNITILFLGDTRQLPSIGSGNCLYDIIKSSYLPITELQNTYRYDDKKVVKKIIDKILKGDDIIELDYINQLEEGTQKEFNLITPNNNIDDDISTTIATQSKEHDIIITALNKDISKYTNIIRDVKNPKFDKIEFSYNYFLFRVGDKIIHTTNDYSEKNLYNGLSGTIESIYTNEENITKIEIVRDDKQQNYTYSSDKQFIKSLRPAFMLSVHKSQGREYDNVLILLTNSRMLNKNLLYTAITRAKKKLTVIGSLQLLNKTSKKKEKRKTLLHDMIIYEYEKIKNIDSQLRKTINYDSYLIKNN